MALHVERRSSFDDTRAWLVVLVSFLALLLVVGFSFSLGIFYIVFLRHFGGSTAMTAWISSLNFGTLCAIGPIGSMMISRLGCRATMFCGGGISSAGLVISSMAQSLPVLFVSLGIVTGAGFGLVFVTGTVAVSFHFKRYRTIAMGLSFSGVGVGSIVFPWVFHALLAEYGWRGALLICAGVNLNVCVCAMFLHPWDNFLNGPQPQQRYNQAIQLELQQTRLDKNGTCKLVQLRKKWNSKKLEKENSNINDEETEKMLVATQNDVQCSKDIIPSRNIGNGVTSTDTHVSIISIGHRQELRTSPWRLFQNLSYCLIHLNCLLFTFGLSVVYTHLPAYAQTLKMVKAQRGSLLSAIGFSNLLGRVGLGFIGHFDGVNVVVLLIVSYLITGVSVVVIGFTGEFSLLLVDVIMFGFFSGAFGPILSEVTVQAVGVEQYNYAYGYMMISMAIGTMIGAPIAGALYDWTHVYQHSFHLGGASVLASAIVTIFVNKKQLCIQN